MFPSWGFFHRHRQYFSTPSWGLGTGDWGMGTGDWGLGTGDFMPHAYIAFLALVRYIGKGTAVPCPYIA
ncbi:MAG: hypothetical protein ACFKPT_25505 [Gloeotrichia echinulata GP01]